MSADNWAAWESRLGGSGTMAKLIIEPDGDEVVRYTLTTECGATELIEANHDDDGWGGMVRIYGALTALAKGVGVEIEDRT